MKASENCMKCILARKGTPKERKPGVFEAYKTGNVLSSWALESAASPTPAPPNRTFTQQDPLLGSMFIYSFVMFYSHVFVRTLAFAGFHVFSVSVLPEKSKGFRRVDSRAGMLTANTSEFQLWA